MNKLHGADRFCVVTGAAGGLGRAVCARLAADGYTVFACDLHECDHHSERVIPLTLDVTDSRSVAELARHIADRTDRIYAVINLAGIFMMGSVSEDDPTALERSLAVNVLGVCRVNTALLPLLQPGHSRIINMSSEVGHYSPAPFNGIYAVSKHALDCYTDVLRRELMYLRIPVCKIRAGSFRTGMLTAAQAQFDALLARTSHYKRELDALEPIMTGELDKGNPPELFARIISRELSRRRPHRCVRIRNSAKLTLLNALPEGMQDWAYRAAMVIFGAFRKSRRTQDGQ